MDSVFTKRHDTKGNLAELTIRLPKDATGLNILNAVCSACHTMTNAYKQIAIQKLAQSKFRTGPLGFVCIDLDDTVFLGSRGEFPSANMVVLANGRPVKRGGTYCEGVELTITHCEWEPHSWEHNLPMQDDFYQDVRKAFANWIAEALK